MASSRDPDTTPSPSERPDDDGRRRFSGVRKLLPGLLALVVLAAILVGLVVLFGADNEPTSPVGRAGGEVAQVDSTPFDGGGSQPDADDDSLVAGPGSRGASPADPSSPATAPGTISADGRSLLGGGSLADRVGENAKGVAVRVQVVANDEGFWVGDSPSDRVFVAIDPRTETTLGTVRVGDRVNLEGRVREAPGDAERRFDLTADDAELLDEQGAYIDADDVESVD